jgi:hypothetical protein
MTAGRFFHIKPKHERSKTIMANRRTLDEQIELAQKELKQKEARIKELLGRQRSKEEKARTHRLCRRGGQVEKLLPKLAVITDEQFDVFVEKVLLSGYAGKILNELMPIPPVEPESGTDATGSTAETRHESTSSKRAASSAQVNTVATDKPVVAGQDSGHGNDTVNPVPNAKSASTSQNISANGNVNGANSTRHTG